MRIAERVSPEIVAAGLSIVVTIGVLGLASRPRETAAGPSAQPSASARTSEPSPSDPLPSLVRSSLSTIIIVNGRLAAVREDLSAELGRSTPRASELAINLRRITAEIIAVDQPVSQLVENPITGRLGTDLERAYGSLVDLVRSVTAQSVQDTQAYVQAAGSAIKLIAALAPLTARAQAILDGVLPSSQPSAGARPSPSGGSAAPPSTAPPVSLPPGSIEPGGLLANGDFEAGPSPWVLRTTPPAAASLAIDPSNPNTGTAAARVDITSGTEARSGISLVQTGLPVQAGFTYRIQLSLRASVARDVRIQLASATGEIYAARVFAATTAWAPVAFDVTVLVDDPAAVFGVDLGRSTASVWLDTMVIRRVS